MSNSRWNVCGRGSCDEPPDPRMLGGGWPWMNELLDDLAQATEPHQRRPILMMLDLHRAKMIALGTLGTGDPE